MSVRRWCARVVVLMIVMHGFAHPVEAQQQQQTDPAAAAACVTLPPNIVMSAAVARMAEGVRAASATFRAQCAAIAAAPNVIVVVQITSAPFGWMTRARGTLTRSTAGTLTATVQLPVTRDYPELLAHELEHVREQMDGLDLGRMAREGEAVDRLADGAFETRRAVMAGRRVAAECQDFASERHRGVVAAPVPPVSAPAPLKPAALR